MFTFIEVSPGRRIPGAKIYASVSVFAQYRHHRSRPGRFPPMRLSLKSRAEC